MADTTQGLRLQSKSAIVTGAATMIGAAVCKRLIAEGATVTLADVDTDGKSIADSLGSSAHFVQTDVTDEISVQACVDASLEHWGGIDLLVNAASTYIDGALAASKSDWLRSYEVNAVGGVMMLAAVVPHMSERGGGAVVNFSSVSAERAQRGRWLYPATKAAIRQITRSAAMDLAAERIRVNSISPGWIWSRPIAEQAEQRRHVADSAAAPLTFTGRVGDPEEIAKLVAFLCSDDASYITGTDIAADGGYLAMGPEGANDPWQVADITAKEGV